MRYSHPTPTELKVLQSLLKHCGYGVTPPIKVIANDSGNKSFGSTFEILNRLKAAGWVDHVMGCWRPTDAARALFPNAPAEQSDPIAALVQIAASRFNIPAAEILSRRRTATAARARGFTILQATRAGITDTAIAQRLGRDLSTISYARKRALELEAMA